MVSQRQLFLQHVAQTSNFPLGLEIKKAQGVWMEDITGKKYLDLISGIGVSNVGHCHPNVVKAVQEQAASYMHVMVYGEYIQTPQTQFAKAISSTLPEELSSVYLVNSGSEANEGAMKLAKRYTGRSKIMSCKHSYHGATLGTLSLSDSEEFTQKFRPLVPGITHIGFNKIEDLELIDDNYAAVIIETIQGEAGVQPMDTEFFKILRKKCNDHGVLLILDEVQCGAGRTGKFWAFEHYGITPDIITTAKGIGGGMPIGAFISSQEIMSCLTNNPILGHITTFGGHPVSAAGAAAAVQFLRDSDLIEQANQKAHYIQDQIKNHTAINEIRNKGLMMAVELDNFENLQKVIKHCIEDGLVTDWFLFNNKSIRIAPPLIITEEEIEWACKRLNRAIEKVY